MKKWTKYFPTDDGTHIVGYTSDLLPKAIYESHHGLRGLQLADPLMRRDVEHELARRNRRRRAKATQ